MQAKTRFIMHFKTGQTHKTLRLRYPYLSAGSLFVSDEGFHAPNKLGRSLNLVGGAALSPNFRYRRLAAGAKWGDCTCWWTAKVKRGRTAATRPSAIGSRSVRVGSVEVVWEERRTEEAGASEVG